MACSQHDETVSREQGWKWGWAIHNPQGPLLVTHFCQQALSSKVPQPPQIAPSVGDQMFKHRFMAAFYIKTITRMIERDKGENREIRFKAGMKHYLTFLLLPYK